MAEANSTPLPRLTPEQRRAAGGQYERANQVLAGGNQDYGIELLYNCCLIDPGNFTYRQALRKAVKNKFDNNKKGESLAFLKNMRSKLRLQTALKMGDYLKVLDQGEQILLRNPWDVPALLAMGEAFQALDLLDQALWTFDQARQVEPTNLKVLRPLARVVEQRGLFTQAIALWELIRKADPKDLEAQHKAKDLAANATIAKGKYQQAIDGEGPSPLLASLSETPLEPAAATAEETPLASTEERLPKEAAALAARIQANPTNANAYLHLASYFRRNDRFDQAIHTLQQGLGPTANHFELVMELMDLEIDRFRRDLVLAEGQLENAPGDPKLQKIQAGLVKEIASRELQYYRARLDRFPTDAASKFEMAVRLVRLGQMDEAIKELQSLRADPRHHGKALYYLGFCFKHKNNWRLAQRNFEEALQHLAANQDEDLRKELLYQLAVGNAQVGDLTRAVDLACELANLDFAYKDIGTLMDQWQTRPQKA